MAHSIVFVSWPPVRIETGKTIPSIDILRKIKFALGVSSDYLLDDNVDEVTPVEIKDKSLAEKLSLLDSLPEQDKKMITYVIETALTKKKILDLLAKEMNIELAA